MGDQKEIDLPLVPERKFVTAKEFEMPIRANDNLNKINSFLVDSNINVSKPKK